MHKLFNVILENIEKDIGIYLKTPFLESSLNSQKLLKILRNIVVVIYAIKTEFNVRLDLFVSLNQSLHTKLLDIFN